MPESRKDGNTDADQKAQNGIEILHPLRSGGLVIGVHEVLYFPFGAQQSGLAFIIILHFDNAVETDRFAHGVQLGHFRGAVLIPGPQSHGDFQAEGGTTGHPQFLQTENGIHKAGGEGQRQHGVQREAAVE